MTPNTRIGTRIVTRIPDADTDEQGHERAIPVGTLGTVADFDGDELYGVDWDNGGHTRWTAEELDRDATEDNR